MRIKFWKWYHCIIDSTARAIQKERYADTDLHCNAHMASKQIRHYCQVGKDVKDLLKQAITHHGLSARAYERILKLSRTVADLEGAQDIGIAPAAGQSSIWLAQIKVFSPDLSEIDRKWSPIWLGG